MEIKPGDLCPVCRLRGLEFFQGGAKCVACGAELTDSLETSWSRNVVHLPNFNQHPYPLREAYPSRIVWTPSDEERATLYMGSVKISFIGFGLFLMFERTAQNVPWEWMPFSMLVVAFLASRVVDFVSTLIGLAFGGIEMNPLSDPRDISKLLVISIFQVPAVIVASWYLRDWNVWIGSGFLLVYTLTGFRAAMSNLVPINPKWALGPDFNGTMAFFFYGVAVVCTIATMVAAHYALPWYIAQQWRL